MLLQNFGSVVVFISYKINQAYIAANLCENRNNPSMHCNGKCQLRKQLLKEEQQEQKNPYTQKENKEITLFCEQLIFSGEAPCFDIHTELTAFYLIKPTHSPANSVFHPPLC
ncbi:hypothetical protein [Chitinophaga qingshengii]|uniref:Uncharacterized protein n=1 Tax=Chitinophaga qingshengii TaxID=1569794 RepID=A0ABR7TKW9_9BACT|nr:hypothetical protein [Chitinophaga qingshengii]MBC9931114.1 hypothetical protein [Chitinophaga qingshengii]